MSLRQSPQLSLPELSCITRTASLQDCEVVLDLDHTLVNSFEYGYSSSCAGKAVPTLRPIFQKVYCDEDGSPELFNAAISRVLLLMKLRPGARSFLRALAQSCACIHVYTKGVRVYMEAVLSLLDPDHSLIQGSRLAREDDDDGHANSQRKFCHKVQRRSSSALLLILDDSPHLWDLSPSGPSAPAAVLPVVRFDFAERLFSRHRPSPLSLKPVPDGDVLLLSDAIWHSLAELRASLVRIKTAEEMSSAVSTPSSFSSCSPSRSLAQLGKKIAGFFVV